MEDDEEEIKAPVKKVSGKSCDTRIIGQVVP